MRVVNVPRGDLSALYGAGITTYGGTFNMGNMSQETMSSGKHGQYIQEINNYYQSDAYIQLANELSALQYKTNLDIEDQLTIKSSWEYIKRRILQGVDLTEQ